MPELVGFQTKEIIEAYGETFDAVGVFGLDFQLLSKSVSYSIFIKRWSVAESFTIFENHVYSH